MIDPLDELRVAAEGVILDALITFVALMPMRAPGGGPVLAEIWAAALLKAAESARGVIDVASAPPAVPFLATEDQLILALGIAPDAVSETVAAMIAQRRAWLREFAAAETPEETP